MPLFQFRNKKAQRNMLNQLILFVITVLLIVWSLPRNTTRHFNYEIGRPWIYGSFIAHFDFPILKSDEMIRHERDSVMKTIQPYYRLSPEVSKTALSHLREKLSGSAALSTSQQHQILRAVERIYQNGIVSSSDYKAITRDTTAHLKILEGKEARTVSCSQVNSPKTAYESLTRQLASLSGSLASLNINENLEPNLVFDTERNQEQRDQVLQSIPTAKGTIQAGEKIIDEGEKVDAEKFQVLQSFERELERRSDNSERLNTLFGQGLSVVIIIMLFTLFLQLFRPQYFKKQRSVLLLYSLLVIFPVLTSLIVKNTFFSIYILPFAMVPVFVRVFMDSFTALVTHLAMVLLCSLAVKYQYEFVVLQITAGFLVIYYLRELSSRSQMLVLALIVTIGYCAVFLPLSLLQGHGLAGLDSKMYLHFVASGVFVLLAYPLMFLFEKLFGFTSNVSLVELLNTNRGLLRKLSEVAPGTFQHSITVGNLAAAIANRIGANSTLVRTGALYHDIGKMKMPVFFTENQKQVNPHDRLTPEESAAIIIGHVNEGLRMAEADGLPQVIRDFIATHHGHGVAKYFYIQAQNNHPDSTIDPAPFTYPGQNPQTKEQAILMMADTVEAASRSLKDISEQTIGELVNRLIDQQVADGFFRNCPISFRDIDEAKKILIARLNAIYHTRIEYPTLQ